MRAEKSLGDRGHGGRLAFVAALFVQGRDGGDDAEADVFEVLSLEGSLNARNVLGGTAPAQVRAQVERHRARLS